MSYVCPDLGPCQPEGTAPPLWVGQCNISWESPRLALPSPTLLATSVASNINTCPQISGESKFPHWRDRRSSRLCGLPSPLPSGVEVAGPKSSSGKTGSAPSCHPYHLPRLRIWHLPWPRGYLSPDVPRRVSPGPYNLGISR